MIIKKTKDADGMNYLIRINKMDFWLDVWREDDSEEWSIDWNQYIFFTKNEDDVKRQAMQENIDNFDYAVDLIYADLPE